jgi:hypothetical protein
MTRQPDEALRFEWAFDNAGGEPPKGVPVAGGNA